MTQTKIVPTREATAEDDGLNWPRAFSYKPDRP
jgi:hypothetical protein